MKKASIIIFLCALWSGVSAQEKSPQKVTLFEMDIAFGMAFPLTRINHYKQYMGPEPLEIIPYLNYQYGIRANLPGTPHSIGVQNTLAAFHKHRGGLCEQASLCNIEAFYDYNFNQGEWFNPFISFGVGYSYAFYGLVSIYDDVNNIGYVPHRGGNYGALCVTPRLGFEVFKHLRLTFAMTYIDKKASFYGFTIGGVIGGGTKGF